MTTLKQSHIEEKAMGISRMGTLAFVLALGAGSGCREEPIIARLNLSPEANAGEDQTTSFDGTPVTLTLDGSGSSDKDGRVVGWRWLSATAAQDGGVSLPADEQIGWPEDVEQPSVTLPEGVWTFSLWVRDDRAAVSEPDTVTITVGNPDPLADPQVAACAAGVIGGVSDACKVCVCKASDECRTSIAACDQDCWNLVLCVDANCPEFDAMAEAGDFSCLVEHCIDFVAGGAAARAAAPCVTACGACTGR